MAISASIDSTTRWPWPRSPAGAPSVWWLTSRSNPGLEGPRALGLHLNAGLDAVIGRLPASLAGEQSAQARQRNVASVCPVVNPSVSSSNWAATCTWASLRPPGRRPGSAQFHRGLLRAEQMLLGDPAIQNQRVTYLALLNEVLLTGLREGRPADVLQGPAERGIASLKKAGVELESDDARVERVWTPTRPSRVPCCTSAQQGRRRSA